MPSVLVRNLDDATMGLLKQRAAENGISLQQELRTILEKAAAEADYWARRAEANAAARRLREELAASGRTFLDSTAIIREDRDSDHGRNPDYRRE